MTSIRPLLNGLALACLTLSLTACATDPPKVVVKPVTEVVETPAYKPLEAGLTRPVPMPELPDGPISNEDVADLSQRRKAAIIQANKQLAEIRALQP